MGFFINFYSACFLRTKEIVQAGALNFQRMSASDCSQLVLNFLLRTIIALTTNNQQEICLGNACCFTLSEMLTFGTFPKPENYNFPERMWATVSDQKNIFSFLLIQHDNSIINVKHLPGNFKLLYLRISYQRPILKHILSPNLLNNLRRH